MFVIDGLTDGCTVGWNCMKSMRSVYRQKPLSHELGSEWVSERASKWTQPSLQTKRMSERCERMSERRSEWLSTLRIDFIVILPTVEWVERLWNQRIEHCAIRSSACSFAPTAHSFTYSALLVSLTHSAAFIRSLAHSLAPKLMGKRSLPVNWMLQFHTVSTHSADNQKQGFMKTNFFRL